MSVEKFLRVYREFSVQHKNQNFEAIVAGIENIPQDGLTAKYLPYYTSILCSSLSASFTMATPDLLLYHLCNCFRHLWSLLDNEDDFIAIFYKLDSAFRKSSIFKPFAAEFLDDIVMAFQKLSCAPSVNPNRFSGLCRLLVVVSKIEIFNDLHQLDSTKQILKWIRGSFFRSDQSEADQANLFTTIEYFVTAWFNTEKMFALIEQVAEISPPNTPDEIDAIITMVMIMSISKPTFARSQDLLHTFTVINHLADALQSPNAASHSTQLIPCLFCKANVIPHTILMLCKVGSSLLSQLFTDKITIPYYLLHFVAAQLSCTMECPNLKFWKQTIKLQIAQTLKLSHHPQGTEALSGLLMHICVHYTRLPTLNEYLAPEIFYQTLSDCASVGNLNGASTILSHYLHAIWIMERADSLSTPAAERLNSALAGICKQQSKIDQYYDIHAELESMNWLYMNAFPIPRIDEIKLLVQVVQYASMKAGALTESMQAAFIHRILTKAKTVSQNFYALRIANKYGTVILPSPNVSQALHERFTAMKMHQKQIPVVDKYRWYSIIANMEFLDYMERVGAYTTENRFTTFEFKDPASFHVMSKHNISSEASLVHRAHSALIWWSKLVAKFELPQCHAEYAWEVDCALQNLRTMGEHMALRLYREEAMNAYRLLHRLARSANNDFAVIQAISYFAANSQEYIESDSKANLDLKVLQGSETMMRAIKSYNTLSSRKQRWIMYCMMNVALYYVSTDRMKEGKELLRYVENLLQKLDTDTKLGERNELLARVRYNSILLSLITRYDMESPFPPIRLAETVLKSCTSVRGVGLDEVSLLPMIVYDTLWDLTRYLIARFDVSEADTLLAFCLKLSGRAGSAFKSAQLLVMWAMVELCKENGDGCEQKLAIIDDLLPMFSHTPIGKRSSPAKAPKMNKYNVCVSPVRHVSDISCISPIREMSDVPFSKYLIKHPKECPCSFCKRPSFRHLLIDISTVYSRLFYVKRNFAESLSAFKQIYVHWELNQDRYDLQLAAGHSHKMALALYRMLWFYGQSLRQANQINESNEIFQKAQKFASSMHDQAIEHELQIQIEHNHLAYFLRHAEPAPNGLQINLMKSGEKNLQRRDIKPTLESLGIYVTENTKPRPITEKVKQEHCKPVASSTMISAPRKSTKPPPSIVKVKPEDCKPVASSTMISAPREYQIPLFNEKFIQEDCKPVANSTMISAPRRYTKPPLFIGQIIQEDCEPVASSTMISMPRYATTKPEVLHTPQLTTKTSKDATKSTISYSTPATEPKRNTTAQSDGLSNDHYRKTVPTTSTQPSTSKKKTENCGSRKASTVPKGTQPRPLSNDTNIRVNSAVVKKIPSRGVELESSNEPIARATRSATARRAK